MIATDEYELLRNGVGLVERPGRTIVELSGAEAAEFLQGQVTNDVEALEPGGGCYAALLDHKGKIRTDLRVLRLAPERLLVDAEGGSRALLNHVFETYSLGRQVSHVDLSDDHVVLSLIGPAARAGFDPAPGETEHEHLLTPSYGVAVATDVGVDLICGVRQAAAARAELDAPAASEEAAECLRIERGRPRLGFELDGVIPEEAGLNERAVSFTKGCYVGQETVARLHYKGKPNRHLRGLRLTAPAARGEAVMLGDRQVGTIGSACVSPIHGPIALALIRREAAPDQQVLIGANGDSATVVDLPFVA